MKGKAQDRERSARIPPVARSSGSDASVFVYGAVVDDMTRCVHYSQPVDIVAIKFWCCQRYYPCHLCHRDDADHPTQPWPLSRRDDPVVLCGACWNELSVWEYFSAHTCPRCDVAFNERCMAHRPLYFEMSEAERN